MTFRRRQNNDYSYDTYNAYNSNNAIYNNSVSGLNNIGLSNSLALGNSIGPYGTSHDAHNVYPTYNGVNGATGVIDWPVQSDVYGTIGNKPGPLTVTVPRTVIEDQHQTVHVPRTVIDTATKTVSIPRTVMDKKSRIIQEPRTIYEQKDEEYKVPKTVIDQETRIIQVPRTVYDEQRITVNVPKTIYESHSRKITVPKTVIHEREEYYEVPRQVVENREVNYDVARTVYDTKTTVVQVPRTVIETKIIEPKPVTYHVTKYVYPNVDNMNNINADLTGGLNNGLLHDNTVFNQTGFHNTGYHHPGGELANLFPDARKTSYNPILGTTTYHAPVSNQYGLYGVGVVRPRSSGANGSSAGQYGGKPYSSSGPYASFEQPKFNATLPNNFSSSAPLYSTGHVGNVFPSFAQSQPQSADLFGTRGSPLGQSSYYKNGVLTMNRQ